MESKLGSLANLDWTQAAVVPTVVLLQIDMIDRDTIIEANLNIVVDQFMIRNRW